MHYLWMVVWRFERSSAKSNNYLIQCASLQLETTAKKKPFKMVIYQRDLSRKLANEAEALAQLQGSLGDDWEIQVRVDTKICAAFWVWSFVIGRTRSGRCSEQQRDGL